LIFLETSFLVNYFVEKNKFHKEAVKTMGKIKGKEKIISEMIIYETLTVLRKLNQNDNELKRDYNSLINLGVFDDKGYYNQALDYTLHKNSIGFFDNLSYIFMVETRIKEIASFDEHFDIFHDIKRIY
jgi:predicted nucleic acid-binding protein